MKTPGAYSQTSSGRRVHDDDTEWTNAVNSDQLDGELRTVLAGVPTQVDVPQLSLDQLQHLVAAEADAAAFPWPEHQVVPAELIRTIERQLQVELAYQRARQGWPADPQLPGAQLPKLMQTSIGRRVRDVAPEPTLPPTDMAAWRPSSQQRIVFALASISSLAAMLVMGTWFVWRVEQTPTITLADDINQPLLTGYVFALDYEPLRDADPELTAMEDELADIGLDRYQTLSALDTSPLDVTEEAVLDLASEPAWEDAI